MMNKDKIRTGSGFWPEALEWIPRALDPINKPSAKRFKPKRMYQWHPGFVAWLLHRLTGAGLAGYLILHLYVLSNLAKGPESFNEIMGAFDSVYIKLLEIGLLVIVVYHSINGLRIVLLDYGPMADKDTYVKYLYGTFLVIAAIILVGGFAMFLKAIGF
jgi:succinate dehydrogenase / fumarate reductase, cytochrome b subunit